MKYYIKDSVETPTGAIPLVFSSLTGRDTWGAFKARLGIGRMHYTVEPGLYAVGGPDPGSPVLVTANYKLSFDAVRKNLNSISAWILVLDTQGINVWCAAGKGTFSTEELVHRIQTTGLSSIIGHKKLILPQLGASGVSAHNVKDISGFSVIYGPVRADDIPAFIENGMNASPEMRKVTFALKDRFVLIPVEFMIGLKYLAAMIIFFIVTAGFSRNGYSLSYIYTSGIRAASGLAAAFLSGTILGPVLLPWLPGRSFSVKGAVAALPAVGCLLLFPSTGNLMETAGLICITAALCSFIVMNFTGATPITSLSGVKKEMRVAVPLQITGAVIGTALWIISRFV